jgi:hypothetical protein
MADAVLATVSARLVAAGRLVDADPPAPVQRPPMAACGRRAPAHVLN